MQSLTKIYRTESVETRALSELSLEVDKGEFIALMGPSGSGKSTFLNIAGLLDDFDSGTYKLDDQDVSQLNDGGRSRIRNSRIGFIFQAYNLIPELNVFDNVDVPLRYRGVGSGKRTELILGAHLLGPSADEMINLFAIAIRHGLTANDLKDVIFAYPTHASDLTYMV